MLCLALELQRATGDAVRPDPIVARNFPGDSRVRGSVTRGR